MKEKYIRRLFDLGVILKGIDGVIETVSGVALLVLSHAYLASIVTFITQEELFEDPHDAIANYLTHAFQGFSGTTQWFGALYLLTHGIVKIALVVGLLRNRLWAYPAAIAIFTAFGLYQIYYIFLDHSLFLVLLTVLDAVVIFLTWHEYKYRKQRHLLA